MKRTLIAFWILLLAVGIAFAEKKPADQTKAPDQLVRETAERILPIIKANRDAYTRDNKKLYELVEKQILPYFDFRAMSKSVLGQAWRNATEEQRERFVKEFKELLVRTYATALLKYTDQEIRYLPFRAPGAEDKTVLVRTEVVQKGGPSIPIHYSFFRSDEGWKVYDIAIEGVSLVTNYRSTYAEKIRAQKLDGLIASLAEANRRGEVQPAAAPVKKGASDK